MNVSRPYVTALTFFSNSLLRVDVKSLSPRLRPTFYPPPFFQTHTWTKIHTRTLFWLSDIKKKTEYARSLIHTDTRTCTHTQAITALSGWFSWRLFPKWDSSTFMELGLFHPPCSALSTATRGAAVLRCLPEAFRFSIAVTLLMAVAANRCWGCDAKASKIVRWAVRWWLHQRERSDG